MPGRRIAIVLAASILSACSNGSVMPPSGTGRSDASRYANRSALRVPQSVLDASRRSLQDTGTSPYPISALAYPISALAFPISALAFAGAPPAQTFAACGFGPPKPGGACKAQINTGIALNPDPHAAPNTISGVQPALLRAIYNLPPGGGPGPKGGPGPGGGPGQTIALVVAYDNPNAESDLAIYRNAFGLPPCTSANGCFTKIAGTGSSLPQPDANWSVESSLDLDAVSAVCSSCKLLLVEAASNLIPDLATAVDTAVANGATAVSNSYGVAEASDNVIYASHYVHAGVPITAAAGDIGFGVQFPASVPTVTAVGGTSVQQIDPNGALQEVVWPLTGGGCSAFFAKPSWQTDTGCTGRTVNDISILADPNDGISVYDSTLPNTVQGGWTVIGGTSLGAPVVAALFAMAAKGNSIGGNPAIYADAAKKQPPGNPDLISITAGNDGTCSVAYLCNGGAGYNAPAGNGVPWGTKALAPTK